MSGEPLGTGMRTGTPPDAEHDRFSETLDMPADHGDAQVRSASPGVTGYEAPLRVASLPGVSLEAVLRQKSLPWRQAAEIVATVGEILAADHARGDCHGGLCPEVIVLTDGGQPMVSGRGTEGASHDAVSSSGCVNPCSAPEQVQAGGIPVGPRSDVYALGVILYRLLCARYPFRSADRKELVREIVEDAPQPPRQLAHGIPQQLEQLCLRLLAKGQSVRPGGGDELACELRRVLMETETSDGAADPTASPAMGRRSAAVIGNEQLVVWTWDVSSPSHLQSGLVTQRLQTALRESLTRCEGTVVVYSENLTVLRFNSLDERGTDLSVLLDHALTFLSGLTTEDATIGFAVETAERDPAQSVGVRHRASRLSGCLSASGLEMTPRTMELLRRWMTCRPVAEADNVWDVAIASGRRLRVRVSREITDAQQEFTTSSLLVGRAAQLAILKARWEQAREGMGQIVLLIGDEGVGKTRLVQELRCLVGDSTPPAHWLLWSCRPGLSGQGFHPAAEFFRDADSRTVAAWPEDVRQHAEELARLTETPRRDQLQPALLEWLKRIAAAAPVVFVIEDVQWVDPATLTFLHTLIDLGLHDRVLTILTFRPEFETPWGSRAHQTQVALSRLTKRHATSVFSAITGVTDPSAALVDQLLHASDGIPLFVEGFARVWKPGTDNLLEIDKFPSLSP
ncbi:MAG: AAA family ATPase [Planctomycetales bacterium]|nr:AAA family ATPase [Planctomycetales bacterium]